MGRKDYNVLSQLCSGIFDKFPDSIIQTSEFLHADQVRICGAETAEKLP